MRRLFQTLVLLFFFGTSATAQNPAPDFTYIRLEGAIGQNRAVLHLHKIHRLDDSGPEPVPFDYYFGTLLYSMLPEPVWVEGEIDSTGMLALSEARPWAPDGHLYLNNKWTGYYTDPDGQIPLTVRMKEAYFPGTVQMNGDARSAKEIWDPKAAESPACSVHSFWLEPTDQNLRPDQRLAISTLLLRTLVGDSAFLGKCCLTQVQGFEYLRNEEFRSFHGIMKSAPMEADSTLPAYLFNRELETQTWILYNDVQMLSLGFYTYYFSGGAHGMYNVQTMTFNLETMNLVTLDDIFMYNYHEELYNAVQRSARRRAGLKPAQALTEAYFTEEIPLTDNFYVTEKGLVFSYEPYEVASYADGQVDLFVPFDELKKYLKPPFDRK